jgi:hypothetical protein
MFERVFMRGDVVVALPRRGTKTVGPVAFDFAGGEEVEIGTLPSADEERVRLDYLSSPVGRGPSQLRLFAGCSPEPVRRLELPDAISGVVEAPFGWYVGCRDGFLSRSTALASSAGAGRRRRRPASASPARASSTSGPARIGWPRTGARRWSAGSAASGLSVRTA